MRGIPLSQFFADENTTIDPAKFSDERFELFSIPAFDIDKPELLLGREIGSAKKLVQPGDILLSRIVPHIRRAWVVHPSNGLRQIASGEWIVFRNKQLVPQFFKYYLISDDFHAQFMKTVAGVGGSLLRARPEGIRRIEVLLPSLDEQRRIARILDQADRLRRLRSHARQLTDTFLQSVFIEMFGGIELECWDRVTVEEVSTYMRTGPFGSQLLHSEFVDNGIAVLGIDNAVKNYFSWDERRYITPQKYNELKRYTVQPEDVLITIMGTCGRCAVVPQDVPIAINTKHLCCITLDKKKCLPTYLHACFLNHPKVLAQLGISQRGAIMDGLNMGIIKELKIPLPPLSVQEKYEKIANKYQVIFKQQQEGERQAELNFQALLHRAFTGQLTSKEQVSR